MKLLAPVAAVLAITALSACQKAEPPAAPAPEAAASAAAAPAAPAEVTVTITDTNCDPATLSVLAGKTTFKIVNKSQKAVEWEILKDVMVVAERENIAPGFTMNLTADLKEGEYAMTCGLLSNPKGKLTVTLNANAQAAAPDNSAEKFAAPVAAYKAYVESEVAALVEATGKFVAAVNGGNLKEAQALYPSTRVHYERIEPIAELFNDLDGSIDARVDDFKKKEADPEFTGFHRLEYGLFHTKSAKGLKPFADKLLADVQELQKRVATLDIPAKKVASGAAELIEEVAKTKISGEEDRYSHTDLWDFQANVDGAMKIFELLQPMLDKADATLSPKIQDNFKQVDALLAKYRSGDGFVSYEKVTKADRTAMKGPITALAEDLSKLAGTLGLE